MEFATAAQAPAKVSIILKWIQWIDTRVGVGVDN